MVWDKKLLLLVLVLLVGVLGFSYSRFIKYQPKSIKQVQEVRGVQTETSDEITYPIGADDISSSQISNKKQATFSIQRPPKDVQNYYKTIFLDRDWELSSDGATAGFYISEFKKGLSRAKVIASAGQSNNGTVVSVEISD